LVMVAFRSPSRCDVDHDLESEYRSFPLHKPPAKHVLDPFARRNSARKLRIALAMLR